MNKIGPHIIEGASVAIGKPAVVKLYNPSVAYVREVRQTVGPQTLIVVRWYEPSQPLDNPWQRANEWMDCRRAAMLAMTLHSADGQIAFESYNEIGDAQAVAYCAFERARLKFMHAQGLRAVVGNFSVGVPDLPTWGIYLPMLADMRRGDLLGLHEYWVDQADIQNRYHCGRWTLVSTLANVPIVVTECNRDKVEGRGQPGWRRTCNAEQILADLRDYNTLLSRYPNVVGATVFTLGQVGVRWRDFECNSIWARVVAEQGTPAPPPVVPPVAPPPPPPGPVIDMAAFLAELADASTELDEAESAIRSARAAIGRAAGMLTP